MEKNVWEKAMKVTESFEQLLDNTTYIAEEHGLSVCFPEYLWNEFKEHFSNIFVEEDTKETEWREDDDDDRRYYYGG